ncbi:hypothetical protein [Paenibacillus ferrarius]|uniref:hypothetical protein n=1 Tax=Paenibacillus ferrarius TaxID=1469647 RepID=UPI001301AEB0|nr:hypothetical protein [Paenibacillus ferrarius]
MIKEKIEKMIFNKKESGESDFSEIKDQIMIYANVELISEDEKDYLNFLIG